MDGWSMDRKLIWLAMIVGSTVGGVIPALWGAGFLSLSGLAFSAVGAIGGIYIAFKMTG